MCLCDPRIRCHVCRSSACAYLEDPGTFLLKRRDIRSGSVTADDRREVSIRSGDLWLMDLNPLNDWTNPKKVSDHTVQEYKGMIGRMTNLEINKLGIRKTTRGEYILLVNDQKELIVIDTGRNIWVVMPNDPQ